MLKLLKRLGKKEIGFAVVCLVFIVAQVWLDLKLPDYMSEVTKLVQSEGTKVNDVVLQGGKMLSCALGSLLSSIIVGYFVSLIAAGFSKNLRRDVFRKVQDFSMEEIKRFSTSSLITRTTNDVMQVQMLIAMGLQVIIKAPITAVWAVLKILGKSWQWSLVTASAVAVLLIVISILISVVLPRFKKVQRLTDSINELTRENLTGIRVVRAFNAEKYQEEKFDKANLELTQTQMLNQRVMAIMSPVMTSIMSGISLAIYWIGAYLINKAALLDKITLFSDMVVFSSYAIQVVMSFMLLSFIFILYPRAAVSAKRILEVLSTKSRIKDGEINSLDKFQMKNKGTIEFKNVSFKYPDAEEYMLKDISFKASQGQTIAFIGSTGSGKSTLINLIPRFYDATDGEVLVDGINVKEYTQEFLHDKIGYISQKAVMFDGTVESNVTYGMDEESTNASEENVQHALGIAQATEFVSKMENGIDSHIARGGTNISGGQKQRLSIARAIAKRPDIYIFDDTFSALDYQTDFKLRKALSDEVGNATVLIVAQRIGTIKNADEIIVLDEGKVVGRGKHKELLKNCEVYLQIARSQLSEEEINNEE